MIEQRSIVLTALIAAVLVAGGVFYYFSHQLGNDNGQPAVTETTPSETVESAELALGETEATIDEAGESSPEDLNQSETSLTEETDVAPDEKLTEATTMTTQETRPTDREGQVLAAQDTQDVVPTAATGYSHLFLFALGVALIISLNSIIAFSRPS